MRQLVCTIEGCGSHKKVRRGLCDVHYQRVWKTGSTERKKSYAKGFICDVPDCERPRFGRGLCGMHYQRLRNHGDPDTLKVRQPGRGEVTDFYNNVVLNYEGDECLEWPFAKGNKGYAQMHRAGKKGPVQRFLCEDVYGPPPTPSHHSAHSCGNGHLACVNKNHLSWKTPVENNADKIAHGTSNRGERHGHAKLTEAQAREVISLRGIESQRSLARRFGISQQTVSDIHRGKHWSWVPREAAE